MWTCTTCDRNVDGDASRCPSCGGRRRDDLAAGPGDVGPAKRGGPPLNCPRCDGAMREGFLSPIQSPVRPRSVLPVQWHEGPPRWSSVWGHQADEPGLPLTGYCCERCGRVEFFAKPGGE